MWNAGEGGEQVVGELVGIGGGFALQLVVEPKGQEERGGAHQARYFSTASRREDSISMKALMCLAWNETVSTNKGPRGWGQMCGEGGGPRGHPGTCRRTTSSCPAY